MVACIFILLLICMLVFFGNTLIVLIGIIQKGIKWSMSHWTEKMGKEFVAASGEAQRFYHWIKIDFIYFLLSLQSSHPWKEVVLMSGVPGCYWSQDYKELEPPFSKGLLAMPFDNTAANTFVLSSWGLLIQMQVKNVDLSFLPLS